MKSILSALSFLAISVALLSAAELRVASFSTITTDLAHNIGGDRIEVIPIVGPGVDPHEFQPTPEEIKKTTQADLVLITGKGIEGYLDHLEETVGAKKFVDASKTIPSLTLEEDGRQVQDPHWWHSIANVKKAVVVIRDALIQADPAGKDLYTKNATTYLDKLSDLDAWAKETISELPRAQRKLVTSHDAFQYFARDYGFTIYPIEGVSPEDEPSSKKVAELIGIIRQQGVKSVFFENIDNPKVIGEITRESGAKIGGKLYADGLGDTEATTYIAMVHYNVTTLVNGLK